MIVVGRLGGSEQVLAFVGGNCSIQGIDHTGEDKFWTVSRCTCTSGGGLTMFYYPW